MSPLGNMDTVHFRQRHHPEIKETQVLQTPPYLIHKGPSIFSEVPQDLLALETPKTYKTKAIQISTIYGIL